MSPAAWRHFSPGDSLLCSGMGGSCSELVASDPPDRLPDSFLPAGQQDTQTTNLVMLLSSKVVTVQLQ